MTPRPGPQGLSCGQRSDGNFLAYIFLSAGNGNYFLIYIFYMILDGIKCKAHLYICISQTAKNKITILKWQNTYCQPCIVARVLKRKTQCVTRNNLNWNDIYFLNWRNIVLPLNRELSRRGGCIAAPSPCSKIFGFFKPTASSWKKSEHSSPNINRDKNF